jgi:hypothetical protein
MSETDFSHLGSDIGSFPLGCALLTKAAVSHLDSSVFSVMTVDCLRNLHRDAVSGLSVDQIRKIPALVSANWTATISALPSAALGGFSVDSIRLWKDYTLASLSAYGTTSSHRH